MPNLFIPGCDQSRVLQCNARGCKELLCGACDEKKIMCSSQDGTCTSGVKMMGKIICGCCQNKPGAEKWEACKKCEKVKCPLCNTYESYSQKQCGLTEEELPICGECWKESRRYCSKCNIAKENAKQLLPYNSYEGRALHCDSCYELVCGDW